MKRDKRNKLTKAGWKVGTVKEFLGLTAEEIRLIETKRALIQLLKDVREANNITQQKLAEMINSSQSRIAKLEAASPDVSLDLVFRALYAMGVSKAKVARTIARLN